MEKELKELKELISDFKEALELLEDYSLNGLVPYGSFEIEELLFRQKRREREGFTIEDYSTYSIEAFEELESSIEQYRDRISELEDILFELKSDIKDALNNYNI